MLRPSLGDVGMKWLHMYIHQKKMQKSFQILFICYFIHCHFIHLLVFVSTYGTYFCEHYITSFKVLRIYIALFQLFNVSYLTGRNVPSPKCSSQFV